MSLIMSATARQKNPCSICKKAAGILTCGGCNQMFCYQHVLEHRQELNKQMDVVVSHHDQFQGTINEQKQNMSKHPLMQKIDEWENDAIEKIRQEAKRARESLLSTIHTHMNKVSEQLKSLTTELTRGQTDNDYVETDIKEWLKMLEKLKKDLNNPLNVNFNPKTDTNALIPRILIDGISTDYFAEKYGEVEILDDGHIFEKRSTQAIVILRGAGEYSSGKHRFSFNLDKFSQNQNFYCGIVTKGSSLNTIASSIWNSNTNWRPKKNHLGQNSRSYDNYESYILLFTLNYNSYWNQRGIDIDLTIDCDNYTIHSTLTNIKKNVKINQCPFPWSFFVGVDGAEARVRISQTNTEPGSASNLSGRPIPFGGYYDDSNSFLYYCE